MGNNMVVVIVYYYKCAVVRHLYEVMEINVRDCLNFFSSSPPSSSVFVL